MSRDDCQFSTVILISVFDILTGSSAVPLHRFRMQFVQFNFPDCNISDIIDDAMFNSVSTEIQKLSLIKFFSVNILLS